MAIKLKLELKWTNIKRVGTIPRGLNLEDFSDYSYDYGDGWEIVVSRMADSKDDEIACLETAGTNAMEDIGGIGCLIGLRDDGNARNHEGPPKGLALFLPIDVLSWGHLR